MGSLYRPSYKAADGTVRTSAVWWIRFRQHGQPVRQSTETRSERTARAILRQQEGRVALSIPIVPKADKLTLSDAATLIRNDYASNGYKSADTVDLRLAHLLNHFDGASRLARITTGDLEQYKAARLDAKAAPSTINREIAVLGRMATLAKRQYGLIAPFHVAKLEERGTRVGFFEDEQFQAVLQQLGHRPELAALVRAARLTGWRRSELTSRQWRHVDFTAGWLRLEPEETKNRDGRMFPLIPELRAVLEQQRARVEAMQRAMGRVIPWIFVRDNGAPVRDFKRAWTTARRRAGIPGKLFHDFRRTAVRNLIRAGIPETVAMKLSGHRTRSVFSRYAIVEEGMLREAGDRLAASRLAGRPGTVWPSPKQSGPPER
jgi:integrase